MIAAQVCCPRIQAYKSLLRHFGRKMQYLAELALPILSPTPAAWDSRRVVGNARKAFQLIAQIHDRSRLAAIDGQRLLADHGMPAAHARHDFFKWPAWEQNHDRVQPAPFARACRPRDGIHDPAHAIRSSGLVIHADPAEAPGHQLPALVHGTDTKCAYPTANLSSHPQTEFERFRAAAAVWCFASLIQPCSLRGVVRKKLRQANFSVCPCCFSAIPASRRIFLVAENPPGAHSSESAASVNQNGIAGGYQCNGHHLAQRSSGYGRQRSPALKGCSFTTDSMSEDYICRAVMMMSCCVRESNPSDIESVVNEQPFSAGERCLSISG